MQKINVGNGNQFIFSKPENQFYVGAKQFYKLNQVNGKVDVIVTDSPLLLNGFYNKSNLLGTEYNDILRKLFGSFNNINFFIKRNLNSYNSNGRN